MKDKEKLQFFQVESNKSPKKSTKVKLSDNFYKNLVEHENKILYDKSIGNINSLINMYKLGIEYYSVISSPKQFCYMEKLKELLMDKRILKIIDEDKKNLNTNKQKIVSITNIKEESKINNNYGKLKTPEAKLSKLIKMAEFKPKLNLIKKSASSIENEIIVKNTRKKNINKKNKINRRSLFSTCSSQLKTKVTKILEKKVKIDIKEIVHNFNSKISDGLSIIESDLSKQLAKFRSNLKEKKFGCVLAKSIPFSRTDKKASKLNSTRKYLSESKFLVNPRISFQNIIMPLSEFNLNDNDLKNNIRKKKVDSINDVFDYFLCKFHNIYFTAVCHYNYNCSLTIINNSFIDKIKCNFKMQNEIDQLNFLCYDDPDSNYVKSLKLMINNLQLEKENMIIELERNTNIKLRNIVRKRELFGFESSNSLHSIIDDLIKSLINLFNK